MNINHWFPLIRTAIRALSLGGLALAGSGPLDCHEKSFLCQDLEADDLEDEDELDKQRQSLPCPTHERSGWVLLGWDWAGPGGSWNSWEDNFCSLKKKNRRNKNGWWNVDFHVPSHPSLPKSSKYLLRRCLEPLRTFSGGVWEFKHLLTWCLED